MNKEELQNYLIANHCFPDDSRKYITSGIHRFVKNRPELLKNIKEVTGIDSENPTELIYCLFNDAHGVCEVCGAKTKFQNYYNGYKKACCRKCADVLTTTKGSTTKIERYGSSSYNNEEKRKQTCLEKYGDPYYVNREQRDKTNLERYGHTWTNNVEKSKATSYARYGVSNPMKLQEFKDKVKNNNIEKYGVGYPMQMDWVKEKFKNNCLEKNGFEWYFGDPDFRSLHIKRTSKAEREIQEFCKGLLPNEEVILQERKLLITEEANRELDIYIPSRKLGIEFNGVYWHSLRPENYHKEKTDLCENKGVRLLHVWSTLWEKKEDIYKSIISSILGVYQRKIFARKCICKEIGNQEYEKFLNENNLFGVSQDSYRLGLYYNNELIQVAGWNCNKDTIVLTTLCSKISTQIVGGISKLCSHCSFKEFTCYLPIDTFTTTALKHCGFKEIGVNPPSYFYFPKRVTHSIIYPENYIQSKVHEIEEDEYYKVQNCGTVTMLYKKA